MATPLVSLNVERKLISASPVEFLANPPVASPFSEISPDIAPLLPSSGGVVPPTSSVPTIPSNPSKNPDEMLPIGPDSAALAPSAFSPVSSAVCCVSLTAYLNIVVLLVVGLFCSI
ncbi:hypothetical protein K7X08_002198 [Anisodus acutangulus]|uniref:Uncharacterized protein n=2 Tax=Anisodus TaxID=243963 RepID=A0A9Q1LP17_9SOLA|nr:hypothetical protein K7X08_002198 [Anisodus acutangulus]